MNQSLNLDLVDLHAPNDPGIFKNDSDDWLAFRKIRFAKAGDGEYAVVRNLDLSNHSLRDFIVDHLAFVQCNLDNASFNGTRLEFGTVFINCSMKNIDFSNTTAADITFLDCDLTGVRIPQTGWLNNNLDDKKTRGILSGCAIGLQTEADLKKDGYITDTSKLTVVQRLSVAGAVNETLLQVIIAPTLDL